MTEYRIVCDVDRVLDNGTVKHYKARTPFCSGGNLLLTTTDKAVAEGNLAKVVTACAKYDEEYRKMARYITPGACRDRMQTNIRIQSREVTEWADN